MYQTGFGFLSILSNRRQVQSPHGLHIFEQLIVLMGYAEVRPGNDSCFFCRVLPHEDGKRCSASANGFVYDKIRIRNDWKGHFKLFSEVLDLPVLVSNTETHYLDASLGFRLRFNKIIKLIIHWDLSPTTDAIDVHNLHQHKISRDVF